MSDFVPLGTNSAKRRFCMKKLLAEFKEFAIKGNMLDLAIGMVIGTAFTTIVKSIVDDIIMPLVGVIIGGKDFTGLAITIGDSQIKYGNLIQNFVNFLIVAVCLFFVVKTINKLKTLGKKEEIVEEIVEETPADIKLLEEIRDLLKKDC